MVIVLMTSCAPPTISRTITAGITFTGLVDADGDGRLDTPISVVRLSVCDRVLDDGALQFCDCNDKALGSEGAVAPLVDVTYRGDGAFDVSAGDEGTLTSNGGHLVIPVLSDVVEVPSAYRQAALYSLSADGAMTAIDSAAVVEGDSVRADYDIGSGVTVHEVHNLARGGAGRAVDRQGSGSLACVGGCNAGGIPRPLVVMALLCGAGFVAREPLSRRRRTWQQARARARSSAG